MLAAWLKAFRIRTLPLALSCILLGSLLAAAQNNLRINILIFSILTAACLQILSNLANDYGDSLNGADHAGRQGPSRAVQSGEISPHAMKRMIIVFVILSLVSGVFLLWNGLNVLDTNALFLMLGIGLVAIVAAITYTMGKRPYGYIGLGDLSVFLFFGLVGVIGVYALHTGRLEWEILMPATSSGMFAVCVLNINNIRDIDSDKQAGKYSIPVRLGQQGARAYHAILLFVGIASAVAYVWFYPEKSLWKWLFLLSFPLFFMNLRGVWRGKTVAELDPYLRQMALTTLFFVILLGTGLYCARY